MKRNDYLLKNLPSRLGEYEAVTVRRDAQFFVALCRLADNPHNYVIAGCFDDDNQPRILTAAGKVATTLCSKARIQSEPVVRRNRSTTASKGRNVNYKAYAITFEQ